MRKILLCLAMAAIAGLSGCASLPKQDYAVKVAYAYAVDGKSASAWRAFMIALDKCHNEGYQDAYPAGQPAVSCDRSSGNACVHYIANASYDCVGLSYQTH